MGRLFGTDGVRGLANADLSPELALAVAVAAAHVLVESRPVAIRRWPWSAGTRGPAARCWRRPWWPGWPAPARTWSGSACCPRRAWRSSPRRPRPTSA